MKPPMKPICKMMILGTVALVGTCSEKKAEQPFRYTVDSFADLKVMRFSAAICSSSLSAASGVRH